MFARSLSTKATRDAEPTGIISVLSVFHPDQSITNTCLNTGLNTVELIGRSTLGQLSVVCILVIVTIMVRKMRKDTEVKTLRNGDRPE